MKRNPPSRKRAPAEARPGTGLADRAQELLLRLETDGLHPVHAAEELDRLQAALGRAALLAEVRERVEALCHAWAGMPLRGDRARAWLSLVGAFDLKEHAPEVAALAEDSGLPAALRIDACRASAAR